MTARTLHRILPGALALALAAGAGCARADEAPLRRPDAAYVQAGAGSKVASATVGVTWDLAWQHENEWGTWDAYLDLSLGHWRVSGSGASHGRQEVTKLGLTPVLRWRPAGWGRFFLEAGIGVNWIFPVYQNGTRQFSTTFNFGDHLAAGWQFGARGDHELTLRLQHFSNAGIRHPNPGENFVQLRYARRF